MIEVDKKAKINASTFSLHLDDAVRRGGWSKTSAGRDSLGTTTIRS